jgi:integrase
MFDLLFPVLNCYRDDEAEDTLKPVRAQRPSELTEGKVFRRVSRNGTRQDAGLTTDVVWYAVKRYAKRIGIDHLAPHDLRRTCARLCHEAGGELEQIRFLLGHASVQTTEQYIGCRQKLREAVNDQFRISLSNDAAKED